MKKKVYGRKLSRDRGSRLALFRSIVKALVLHGEIKTTLAKAKALQPEIEKLVSLAKKDGISVRRRVYAFLANDRKTTDSLFGVASQFAAENSGFTRVVRFPKRRGDKSSIVRLEWSQEISLSEQAKSKKVVGKAKPVEVESKIVKPSLRSRIAKLSSEKPKK